MNEEQSERLLLILESIEQSLNILVEDIKTRNETNYEAVNDAVNKNARKRAASYLSHIPAKKIAHNDIFIGLSFEGPPVSKEVYDDSYEEYVRRCSRNN